MSLLDRTRAVLPSWLAIYYEDPIEIERGEGRRIWDTQGRAYLDFFGGILTTMTAHALPEVTKAVSEQAGREAAPVGEVENAGVAAGSGAQHGEGREAVVLHQ